MKIKEQIFKITHEEIAGGQTMPSVVFDMPEESTLYEVLTAFQTFLTAAGYFLPEGKGLGLVDREETGYVAKVDMLQNPQFPAWSKSYSLNSWVDTISGTAADKPAKTANKNNGRKSRKKA